MPAAVAKLRESSDGDLVIMGSGELIGSLMDAGMIDVFVLMIHPLVLGTGRRLFGHANRLAELHLVESIPTTTGVIIATYRHGRV